MSKELTERVTLESFRDKAIDKHRNRKLVADIEVKGFGMIPFKRPSDNDLLEYVNGAAKGAKVRRDENGKTVVDETDITPVAEASKILVYKCCEYLHDKELQEEVDPDEPFDMPFLIFGLTETISIAEKISDTFGSNEIAKDIKN